MSYINYIPGAGISPMDFIVIEELAKLVPENGTIVEIGSHFGRSTRGWLDNSKSSVKVVAIDPWIAWRIDPNMNNITVIGDVDLLPMPVESAYVKRKEIFDYFIPDDRVIKIRDHSPPDPILMEELNLNSIDLVFVDGDHSKEGVVRDINFWYSKLSSTGIICGHDYNYKGVYDAVNEFVLNEFEKNNNLEVIGFPYSSCMWVIKSKNIYNDLFSENKNEEIFKRTWVESWIKPNVFTSDPDHELIWENNNMRPLKPGERRT